MDDLSEAVTATLFVSQYIDTIFVNDGELPHPKWIDLRSLVVFCANKQGGLGSALERFLSAVRSSSSSPPGHWKGAGSGAPGRLLARQIDWASRRNHWKDQFEERGLYHNMLNPDLYDGEALGKPGRVSTDFGPLAER